MCSSSPSAAVRRSRGPAVTVADATGVGALPPPLIHFSSEFLCPTEPAVSTRQPRHGTDDAPGRGAGGCLSLPLPLTPPPPLPGPQLLLRSPQPQPQSLPPLGLRLGKGRGRNGSGGREGQRPSAPIAAGVAVAAALLMALGTAMVDATAVNIGSVAGMATVAATSPSSWWCLGRFSRQPEGTMPPPMASAPPSPPTDFPGALRCDTEGPTVRDGRRGWYLARTREGNQGEPCFVPAGAGTCSSPIEFPDAFLTPPSGAAIDNAAMAAEGLTRTAAETPSAAAMERHLRVVAPSPFSPPSPVPQSCGGDRPETELIRTTPIRETALTARLRILAQTPVTGLVMKDLVMHALPTPGPDLRDHGSLLYEKYLFRLLGLTRNTMAGAVHRETDLYDVLGVSRVTVGVCTEVECADGSAVAVAESLVPDFSLNQLPLLMLLGDVAPHSSRDLRIPSPPPRQQIVSMGDEGVLTLGWAVLSNPSWLRPVASEAAGGTASAWPTAAPASSATEEAAHWRGPWDLYGKVILDTTGAPGRHSSPVTHYYLNEDDTSVSSRWLPAVFGVLCREPIESFVRLRAVTCGCGQGDCQGRGGGDGGAGSRGDSSGAGADDGKEYGGGGSPTSTPADRLKVLGATGGDTARVGPVPRSSKTSRVAWFISPRYNSTPTPERSPQQCPSLAEPTHDNPRAVVWRPPWVAGRGMREINRESVAEAALAATIRTCLLNVTQTVPREPQASMRVLASALSTDHFTDVEAELQRFSNAYDRRVFPVEPPPEPTGLGSILLALLVLVPELIALISVSIASPQVGRRELVLTALLFVAGFMSSGGIILLAISETHGASWRAGAIRDRLRLDLGLNATGRSILMTGGTDLQGAGIYRTETLVVVARNGYHPRLLVSLAIAFSVVYVGLSGAVVSLIMRQARRPPPLPQHRWTSPQYVVVLARKRRVRRWLFASRRKMAAEDR